MPIENQHKSYEKEENNFNKLILTFKNYQLETAFRSHYNKYVSGLVVSFCLILSLSCLFVVSYRVLVLCCLDLCSVV
jgi:hypothetical protein